MAKVSNFVANIGVDEVDEIKKYMKNNKILKKSEFVRHCISKALKNNDQLPNIDTEKEEKEPEKEEKEPEKEEKVSQKEEKDDNKPMNLAEFIKNGGG